MEEEQEDENFNIDEGPSEKTINEEQKPGSRPIENQFVETTIGYENGSDALLSDNESDKNEPKILKKTEDEIHFMFENRQTKVKVSIINNTDIHIKFGGQEESDINASECSSSMLRLSSKETQTSFISHTGISRAEKRENYFFPNSVQDESISELESSRVALTSGILKSIPKKKRNADPFYDTNITDGSDDGSDAEVIKEKDHIREGKNTNLPERNHDFAGYDAVTRIPNDELELNDEDRCTTLVLSGASQHDVLPHKNQQSDEWLDKDTEKTGLYIPPTNSHENRTNSRFKDDIGFDAEDTDNDTHMHEKSVNKHKKDKVVDNLRNTDCQDGDRIQNLEEKENEQLGVENVFEETQYDNTPFSELKEGIDDEDVIYKDDQEQERGKSDVKQNKYKIKEKLEEKNEHKPYRNTSLCMAVQENEHVLYEKNILDSESVQLQDQRANIEGAMKFQQGQPCDHYVDNTDTFVERQDARICKAKNISDKGNVKQLQFHCNDKTNKYCGALEVNEIDIDEERLLTENTIVDLKVMRFEYEKKSCNAEGKLQIEHCYDDKMDQGNIEADKINICDDEHFKTDVENGEICEISDNTENILELHVQTCVGYQQHTKQEIMHQDGIDYKNESHKNQDITRKGFLKEDKELDLTVSECQDDSYNGNGDVDLNDNIVCENQVNTYSGIVQKQEEIDFEDVTNIDYTDLEHKEQTICKTDNVNSKDCAVLQEKSDSVLRQSVVYISEEKEENVVDPDHNTIENLVPEERKDCAGKQEAETNAVEQQNGHEDELKVDDGVKIRQSIKDYEADKLVKEVIEPIESHVCDNKSHVLNGQAGSECHVDFETTTDSLDLDFQSGNVCRDRQCTDNNVVKQKEDSEHILQFGNGKVEKQGQACDYFVDNKDTCVERQDARIRKANNISDKRNVKQLQFVPEDLDDEGYLNTYTKFVQQQGDSVCEHQCNEENTNVTFEDRHKTDNKDFKRQKENCFTNETTNVFQTEQTVNKGIESSPNAIDCNDETNKFREALEMNEIDIDEDRHLTDKTIKDLKMMGFEYEKKSCNAEEKLPIEHGCDDKMDQGNIEADEISICDDEHYNTGVENGEKCEKCDNTENILELHVETCVGGQQHTKQEITHQDGNIDYKNESHKNQNITRKGFLKEDKESDLTVSECQDDSYNGYWDVDLNDNIICENQVNTYSGIVQKQEEIDCEDETNIDYTNLEHRERNSCKTEEERSDFVQGQIIVCTSEEKGGTDVVPDYNTIENLVPEERKDCAGKLEADTNAVEQQNGNDDELKIDTGVKMRQTINDYEAYKLDKEVIVLTECHVCENKSHVLNEQVGSENLIKFETTTYSLDLDFRNGNDCRVRPSTGNEVVKQKEESGHIIDFGNGKVEKQGQACDHFVDNKDTFAIHTDNKDTFIERPDAHICKANNILDKGNVKQLQFVAEETDDEGYLNTTNSKFMVQQGESVSEHQCNKEHTNVTFEDRHKKDTRDLKRQKEYCFTNETTNERLLEIQTENVFEKEHTVNKGIESSANVIDCNDETNKYFGALETNEKDIDEDRHLTENTIIDLKVIGFEYEKKSCKAEGKLPKEHGYDDEMDQGNIEADEISICKDEHNNTVVEKGEICEKSDNIENILELHVETCVGGQQHTKEEIMHQDDNIDYKGESHKNQGITRKAFLKEDEELDLTVSECQDDDYNSNCDVDLNDNIVCEHQVNTYSVVFQKHEEIDCEDETNIDYTNLEHRERNSCKTDNLKSKDDAFLQERSDFVQGQSIVDISEKQVGNYVVQDCNTIEDLVPEERKDCTGEQEADTNAVEEQNGNKEKLKIENELKMRQTIKDYEADKLDEEVIVPTECHVSENKSHLLNEKAGSENHVKFETTTDSLDLDFRNGNDCRNRPSTGNEVVKQKEDSEHIIDFGNGKVEKQGQACDHFVNNKDTFIKRQDAHICKANNISDKGNVKQLQFVAEDTDDEGYLNTTNSKFVVQQGESVSEHQCNKESTNVTFEDRHKKNTRDFKRQKENCFTNKTTNERLLEIQAANVFQNEHNVNKGIESSPNAIDCNDETNKYCGALETNETDIDEDRHLTENTTVDLKVMGFEYEKKSCNAEWKLPIEHCYDDKMDQENIETDEISICKDEQYNADVEKGEICEKSDNAENILEHHVETCVGGQQSTKQEVIHQDGNIALKDEFHKNQDSASNGFLKKDKELDFTVSDCQDNSYNGNGDMGLNDNSVCENQVNTYSGIVQDQVESDFEDETIGYTFLEQKERNCCKTDNMKSKNSAFPQERRDVVQGQNIVFKFKEQVGNNVVQDHNANVHYMDLRSLEGHEDTHCKKQHCKERDEVELPKRNGFESGVCRNKEDLQEGPKDETGINIVHYQVIMDGDSGNRMGYIIREFSEEHAVETQNITDNLLQEAHVYTTEQTRKETLDEVHQKMDFNDKYNKVNQNIDQEQIHQCRREPNMQDENVYIQQIHGFDDNNETKRQTLNVQGINVLVELVNIGERTVTQPEESNCNGEQKKDIKAEEQKETNAEKRLMTLQPNCSNRVVELHERGGGESEIQTNDSANKHQVDDFGSGHNLSNGVANRPKICNCICEQTFDKHNFWTDELKQITSNTIVYPTGYCAQTKDKGAVKFNRRRCSRHVQKDDCIEHRVDNKDDKIKDRPACGNLPYTNSHDLKQKENTGLKGECNRDIMDNKITKIKDKFSSGEEFTIDKLVLGLEKSMDTKVDFQAVFYFDMETVSKLLLAIKNTEIARQLIFSLDYKKDLTSLKDEKPFQIHLALDVFVILFEETLPTPYLPGLRVEINLDVNVEQELNVRLRPDVILHERRESLQETRHLLHDDGQQHIIELDATRRLPFQIRTPVVNEFENQAQVGVNCHETNTRGSADNSQTNQKIPILPKCLPVPSIIYIDCNHSRQTTFNNGEEPQNRANRNINQGGSPQERHFPAGTSNVNWPHAFLNLEQLAEAGLQYLGYEDRTYCSFCGVQILEWEPGDDPLSEHVRLSPSCVWAIRRYNEVRSRSQISNSGEEHRQETHSIICETRFNEPDDYNLSHVYLMPTDASNIQESCLTSVQECGFSSVQETAQMWRNEHMMLLSERFSNYSSGDWGLGASYDSRLSGVQESCLHDYDAIRFSSTFLRSLREFDDQGYTADDD